MAGARPGLAAHPGGRAAAGGQMGERFSGADWRAGAVAGRGLPYWEERHLVLAGEA